MIIDSHAHIYLDHFNNDLELIVQRAIKQHVIQILMPAIDSTTHNSMLAVANSYPGICIPMIGVHPCSIKENFELEIDKVKFFLEKNTFCAIGEIGLDFYWDTTFADQQYEAFNRQIELALLHDLPIVIHSRNSLDECITIVEKYTGKGLRGVFHCFSGTEEQVERIINAGFYMGIGGVITYKKSGLDSLIKNIDMRHILLETDAPYLTPVPYRGKRNEPSYVPIIAQRISECTGMPIEEISRITTENTKKLFRL